MASLSFTLDIGPNRERKAGMSETRGKRTVDTVGTANPPGGEHGRVQVGLGSKRNMLTAEIRQESDTGRYIRPICEVTLSGKVSVVGLRGNEQFTVAE